MGFFDKLWSVFSKKQGSASATTDADQSGMITVYDKFGRQVLIQRDEWQKKVLPSWLKQHWDNADALYSTIHLSLQDGFFKEVLEASKQLLAIDPNSERSHTIRGIILMKTGDLDGAERIFQDYIQRSGPTGTILTNLAKVYSERGNDDQAEATLWEGLKLDPNQENGLGWWVAIQRERDAQNGFLNAMHKAAAIDGSWRPQLWLARECLQQNNLAEAKRYYGHVLNVAADQSDVLMAISGELGKNGLSAEVLNIVLPLYDPEKHEYGIGHNILQAYWETKNYVDGEKFLHRMFALNRPDRKDDLMFYSAEFDKLRWAARSQAAIEPPIDVSTVRIDLPIWYYGLKDPKWLLRSHERSSKAVVFIALANTSQSPFTDVTEHREDDLGRLTRSIPLYLLESLHFWTDLKPSVVIPTVTRKSPIVSGTQWPPEHIFKFSTGTADTAVAGAIEQTGEKLTLELAVWDCRAKKLLKTFNHSGTRRTLSTVVLKAEEQMLDYFDSLSVHLDLPKERFYSRPSSEVLDRYLVCLGQSLMGTLAQNEAISREGRWGERNMFEVCLATALDMKAAQVPQIMFLSSLAHGRACGSSIYTEFRKQALALLEDEKNTESEFYRLSPLLFKIFDMQDEFVQRRTELLQHADPLYRQWLDGLITSKESANA